ncbi:acyltransferase [Exophiala viscosa]|uniref:acyltransferase n=1 Tax=Exophiala viscosa TaxID=2486360 RepID=UPI002194F193|nr:acyltransferase [Exophiala viscosa]
MAALEPAAGFSLESPGDRPDGVPLKKGEYSIASRALALSTYFLSGALAINLTQFLGAPLAVVNQDWYNAWIAFTKQSFGLLTMTLTQTFAPTKVIVSGDASVRGQLFKSVEGDLVLDFPERLILIANHQIYTDWLYLWWIAYCNGMHGRLYIILKESLKKIPVLGWGMQFNQFIFLKRNWEQDRPNMASALQRLNKPEDPMWLLLFPEGTNLAPSTRAKSTKWADKQGIPDTRHVLLPRSTGLHFCLEELKNTVDYVYDCTVAYEGVPRGQFAQDIFTLKSGYLEGRPPKSVSMHWRRFAVKDIPLHNDKAFELWLLARWREKDVLIEKWYQTGRFPADAGATKYRSGKVLRGCGHMEVPIRASHWYEFLQIFAPMGILAMVLYIFYGDLPQKFWKSINKQALQSGSEDIKRATVEAGKGAKSVGTSLSGLTLDSFFDPNQQKDTFKSGAMAVQKLLMSPSAQTLLNRADFMQQFLSDPQKMVTEGITSKQQNFMQQLAEEEGRRQQGRLAAAPSNSVRPVANGAMAKRGSFWSALEAEEKNRQGSVSGKGTFWQDLKAAEQKKNAPPVRVNFYDAMKAEENNRYGTVVTVSSNASTAVASTRSTSTKASGPAKLSGKTNTSTMKPVQKAATAKKPAAIGPAKMQSTTTPGIKSTPTKKPTTSAPPAAAKPVKPLTVKPSKPPTKQTHSTNAAPKPLPAKKHVQKPAPAAAAPPKLSRTTSSTTTSTTAPKKLSAQSKPASTASVAKSIPAKKPATQTPSTNKAKSVASTPSTTTKAPPRLNGSAKPPAKTTAGPPKLKT